MLLNIVLPENKMTGDELRARLDDFMAQEVGLADMIKKSTADIRQYGHNFFAGTNHKDLEKMRCEVIAEISRIKSALKASEPVC